MLRRFILPATVILCAIGFVSCSEKDESIEIKGGYAAKIGNTKITLKEVKEKWASLSEPQRNEYKGPDAKAKFVDALIEQEILYLDALSKNLDNIEPVREKIEEIEKAILSREYFNREIMDKVEVSDEAINDYYEENKEAIYRTRGMCEARYLFSEDSMKCVEWKERLDRGADFSRLAKEESEDELTASSGGYLGEFNPDGYVKSVGYSEKFLKGIKDLEVDGISDVIAFEKGYCLVKMLDREPPQPRPLSEVRKNIVNKLKGTKMKEAYRKKIAELMDKYNVVNYERERYEETLRTPEELWEVARIEEDPVERIQYYRDLVNQYPASKYAAQALFMIGFVYSEEMGDIVQAKRTFNELIKNYPESEMVDSARWMIKNISKPHPDFESIEDINEQMRKESSSKE
jgi:parvulin-like peptidyl-prolyl isomerase